MNYPLHFGMVSCLLCGVFLFAQSNPSSTEQKQESPAAGTPSSAPVKVLMVCSEKHRPPCAQTPPRAVFAPDPGYSQEARDAKYQGTSVLWTIVGTDGRTHDTKVVRKLGHGLDENAIEAVKQWTFEPARSEGQPVPVQINIEVTFRLHSMTVSPTSAQVVTSATQQFSIAGADATNEAVKWSVGGPDCTASACGSISSDGLYTAPVSVPNSPTVIVTATSMSDPRKTGSARVTIQPSRAP